MPPRHVFAKLLLCVPVGLLAAQQPARPTEPLVNAGSSVTAASLTTTEIDALLGAAWREAGLATPARCSDEVYLRRLSLDLLGRIPTVEEQNAFLRQPDRQLLVKQMLESDQFSRHWGRLWGTQLYGYTREPEDSRVLLIDWLTKQVANRQPYDKIVTEMLTAEGESAFSGPVNFLIRYPEEPIVKVSRAFLGMRLDCARCHDHPFDRWTEEDFAGMNRFFSRIDRREVSAGNIRLVDTLELNDEEESTNEQALPKFLTGVQPRTSQWRGEFSLFLISSRPFARHFANQVWYHLIGRGIIHPVDDVSRENPAALPVLLERLTDEARRSQFDLRHLIELICLSNAYQAESTVAESSVVEDNEQAIRLFANKVLKPLTPDQWIDSYAIATEQEISETDRLEFIANYLGDAFEEDFASTWTYRETIQGFMSRLATPLAPLRGEPEQVFQRILARRPSVDEMKQFGSLSNKELAFVLLHSSEFAFNY